jgi:hypothetical protein
MVPEEAVRQRSYQIWLREGCPDGSSLDHWCLARAELEIECLAHSQTGGGRWQFVLPRLAICPPPRRVVSKRIPRNMPRSTYP